MESGILRQVRDVQGRVLIWGWAEYDEVFSDAKRHRTEFCYQLVVTGSPAAMGRLQPIQGCITVPTRIARKSPPPWCAAGLTLFARLVIILLKS